VKISRIWDFLSLKFVEFAIWGWLPKPRQTGKMDLWGSISTVLTAKAVKIRQIQCTSSIARCTIWRIDFRGAMPPWPPEISQIGKPIWLKKSLYSDFLTGQGPNPRSLGHWDLVQQIKIFDFDQSRGYAPGPRLTAILAVPRDPKTTFWWFLEVWTLWVQTFGRAQGYWPWRGQIKKSSLDDFLTDYGPNCLFCGIWDHSPRLKPKGFNHSRGSAPGPRLTAILAAGRTLKTTMWWFLEFDSRLESNSRLCRA
jgi:hypothetical protein